MGYGYYGMFFDPTYFLVLIGVLLSLGASMLVKSTFAKYANVRTRSGMTGAQAAEMILRNSGINDVRIEHVSGNLTDHYDPKNKVLRLSDSVYQNSSVSAVGVAAHECGHAIQHKKGYAPLQWRGALVPVANFGSAISWPLIIAGIFLGNSHFLITFGIVLFSAAVLFQIITLPVEFNASRRAVGVLNHMGILDSQELGGAKKVLSAAALTYVAAAAGAILQLLRLIILFGGNRDD